MPIRQRFGPVSAPGRPVLPAPADRKMSLRVGRPIRPCRCRWRGRPVRGAWRSFGNSPERVERTRENPDDKKSWRYTCPSFRLRNALASQRRFGQSQAWSIIPRKRADMNQSEAGCRMSLGIPEDGLAGQENSRLRTVLTGQTSFRLESIGERKADLWLS